MIGGAITVIHGINLYLKAKPFIITIIWLRLILYELTWSILVRSFILAN